MIFRTNVKNEVYEMFIEQIFILRNCLLIDIERDVWKLD